MTPARLGFLSWVVPMPILALLYCLVPVSPDQALFDYIAWAHLQGDTYYAGAAEQNWPGKMLIHELGIRLFGVHFWTFRAIDFLLMQGAALAGFVLLRRSGCRTGAWLVLVLYPVLYVTAGSWMAGQRDIVAAGALIGAAALTLGGWRAGEAPSRAAPEVFTAGVLVAVAVLIRPTYLSYLIGLMALEWLRFRPEHGRNGFALSRMMLLLAGFTLSIGLVVFVGWKLGALDDFYEQAILFNLQAYPTSGERLRLLGPLASTVLGSWHWIAALGIMGLGLWIWRSGLLRTQILIVGLIATVLVSFFFQNKGFGYHLGGLIPAFTLLIAAGVDRPDRALEPKSARFADHIFAPSPAANHSDAFGTQEA